MIETRSKWLEMIPGTGLELADVYDQGDSEYNPGIFSILNRTTSDVAQKNFRGKTGFGKLSEFAEGDAVPSVQRYATYLTQVAYNNIGGSVEVTKNQIEDRDYEAELNEFKDMSRRYNYQMDEMGIQLFNGGFATTTKVNGYTLTWYGDGEPQYSTIHSTEVPGASTQSNASSTGITFGVDNYETGALALELQQTDNGMALSHTGKNMVVVPLKLDREAKEVAGSEMTPENANNAINVYRGMFDIASSKFLDSENSGSDKAWYIIKQGDHKLYHETRQEKRLESAVDIKTKTVTFTIDGRVAAYSLEWKGTWGSKGDGSAYSS